MDNAYQKAKTRIHKQVQIFNRRKTHPVFVTEDGAIEKSCW